MLWAVKGNDMANDASDRPADSDPAAPHPGAAASVQEGPPDPSTGMYPPPYPPPPYGYYGAYPYYTPYSPYPPPPFYPGPMATATSGWAIASLIVALAGSLVVPVIGSLLGAIFGHIALDEINRSQGRLTGRGLAIAGIVVGYVFTALYLVFYGYLIFVLIFALSSQTSG